MAVLFLVVSATLGLERRYLHDEGLFTFELARALPRAPCAVFFFVKAKPTLMLLSVLPATLGWPVYVVFHSLEGAAAVWLASATARRLGVDLPNVAGLFLATGLSFTIGVSNGYPNTDGCFVLALFLFCYFADLRVLAALLLGALPFTRNELTVVTLLFLGWDVIVRRDVRFVLGVLSFGTIYALGGALYHHDPFWLVTKFPNPQGMPSALKIYHLPSLPRAVRNLQVALLSNSPLLACFAIFGARRVDRRSGLVLTAALGIYVVMTACQVIGVFGFDTSPRYYVAPLALMALLAAWALSAEPPAFAWVAAPGLVMTCIFEGRTGACVAGVTLLAAVARLILERRRLAVSILALGAIGLVGVQLCSEDGVERAQHRALHALVSAMEARGIYRGQTLFTDLYAARYDCDAGLCGKTSLLVNAAIDWELRFDANPSNGQYDALVRELGAAGLVFDPASHVVRRDAVYAIRDEERTKAWRDRVLAASPRHAAVGSVTVYWW